ncbi:MAG: hypothetical protein JEZ11_16410 [Desulfobacterales bacterium]|nr:hypothetical protein [Desulfobacterales bacterium]
MHRPEWIDRGFNRVVDAVFAAWPQPVPTPAALRRCRLVSHRGEHDNAHIFENTLAAFDRALSLGVWGVEFDLRWTRDLHPVVHHDSHLERIFGSPLHIRDLTLAQLRTDFPLVPTLAEVIHRYGRKMHLMMEIKAEPYPDRGRQNKTLGELFAPLKAKADYHLLSLTPGMFDVIDFVAPDAFLLIGEIHLPTFSRLALARGFGGVCGHYLFASRRHLRRHQRAGQGVGTGYPASKNVLFREINRGVDWLFSNHAGTLQRICDDNAQDGRIHSLNIGNWT